MNKFFKKLVDSYLKDVHANSGQTFASTDRHDPYKNFNFRVTITGKKNFAKAGFRTVSGLKATTDVVEYRDGNDTKNTPSKSGGLTKYEPVTMARGISEDKDIVEWMDLQVNGNDGDYKCTVLVELLDRGRNPVKQWELEGAWIFDYEVSEFEAEGDAVALETIQMHHEGMTVRNLSGEGTASGGFNAG